MVNKAFPQHCSLVWTPLFSIFRQGCRSSQNKTNLDLYSVQLKLWSSVCFLVILAGCTSVISLRQHPFSDQPPDTLCTGNHYIGPTRRCLQPLELVNDGWVQFCLHSSCTSVSQCHVCALGVGSSFSLFTFSATGQCRVFCTQKSFLEKLCREYVSVPGYFDYDVDGYSLVSTRALILFYLTGLSLTLTDSVLISQWRYSLTNL